MPRSAVSALYLVPIFICTVNTQWLTPKTMSSIDREMFPTTCADCKKETQVPFKPTEGRPVYCKECLPKHRPARF